MGNLKNLVYDLGFQAKSALKWSAFVPDPEQQNLHVPERKIIKYDFGPFISIATNIGLGAFIGHIASDNPKSYLTGLAIGTGLSLFQIIRNGIRVGFYTNFVDRMIMNSSEYKEFIGRKK